MCQKLNKHSNTKILKIMENVLKNCSFDSWYEALREKNKTVRSEIVPLPDDFVQFLLDGEFIMEDEMFPELEAKVTNAIREIGGHAFVKLNYTAPIDAQWIGPQRTMEVQNFKDIIYLMKASTRVLLDLTSPFGYTVEGIKPILVLKKYFDYKRNREFRVFQKHKGLRFISSRYDDIPCNISKDDVEKLINEFADYVSDIIPDDKLIFDIYISPKMRTHLIDVAPWNDATSASMFTWQEIEEMTQNETRLCTKCVIRPLEDPPVPIELTGGASLTELIEAMKDPEKA